ncbi:uncharacterized protein C2845_PM01G08100 [Panicum miliaceum]|uniref:Uncharacterized protein n=1 Tax=Panicum miliaceum TaxID=4540 RepID=A0A3L6TLC5_PANMI|nr:uncharacterized protein C2845_PM01G08100 [Panicum miliaceum]
MDSSSSQQKKPRKASSISKRSASAPAVAFARTGASPSCLSASSGALAGGPGDAAPVTGGGTSGHPTPSAFWIGMSLGGLSLGSSERCLINLLVITDLLSAYYQAVSTGGFVNSLQMPYPYPTYPNASQLQENSHFVGCPSTGGTPSPNGSSLAKDGIEAQETNDIDGNETPKPARTDKWLNWSHEEDVRLVIFLCL